MDPMSLCYIPGFQCHVRSGEEIVESFLPYWGVAAILVMSVTQIHLTKVCHPDSWVIHMLFGFNCSDSYRDYIRVYSPGAGTDSPLGSEFYTNKSYVTLAVCCKFLPLNEYLVVK